MTAPDPTPLESLPLLDARTLRELGEHADSYRDVEMCVVARPRPNGGYEYVVRALDAALAPGETRVMRIMTPSVAPGYQPPVTTVRVDGRERSSSEFGKANAFFWTPSAVEKFLFPYYEAMRIFEPDYLERLKARYYEAVATGAAVGIVHIFPSRGLVLVGSELSVTVHAP